MNSTMIISGLCGRMLRSVESFEQVGRQRLHLPRSSQKGVRAKQDCAHRGHPNRARRA